MSLNRAVSLGSLAIVGVALALAPAQTAGAPRVLRNADTDLTPRKPTPRTPTAQLKVPIGSTGSIIVKFRDNVRTRVLNGVIGSMSNVNIDPTRAIMDQFSLTAKPALPWTPERLGRLEAKAAANSRKAQPDLAGIIEFGGPAANLLAAAKALNELPTVEWVDFRRPWGVYAGPALQQCCFPPGAPIPCADLTTSICAAQGGISIGIGTDCATGLSCVEGACCTPDPAGGDDICGLDNEIACVFAGGDYQGPNTDCDNDPCTADEQCGSGPDTCFEVHGTFFCNDEDCCNLICALLPHCCDEDSLLLWDQECVDTADLHCEGPCINPALGCPDRCGIPTNGNCFLPHLTSGCSDPACCSIVCAVEPGCCGLLASWVGVCAELAIEFCNPPTPPGPTPMFTNLQGYLREEPYIQQANGAPASPPLAFPGVTPGFLGDGWNLGGANYALWVINEINASIHPTLGDANGDGAVSAIADEFVEIINNFYIDVNIAGWTLSDSTGTIRHTFPSPTVVRAAEAIVVFGGTGASVPTGFFGGAVVQVATPLQVGAPPPQGPLSLDDGGDTVTLTDGNGAVVASYTYGAEAGFLSSISRFGLDNQPQDVTGPETAGLRTLFSCDVDGDCASGVCFGGPSGVCAGVFSPGTRVDGAVFKGTFEGLYGLSRQIFEVEGVGETSPPGSTDFDDIRFNARGKGVKVGVIEFAFYQGHEDLDVISEPGIPLWIVPENQPDHGTATLGIINAKDNDKGITGIAPEAQAYFFPLTSAQTGPRWEAAFLSAYETLDAGDVVSCSFGPDDQLNLNNLQFTRDLIEMGTDMGITTCIAAGDGCLNLSQVAANLDDSGAIVVASGQSGFPLCRPLEANFFTAGDLNLDSNVIHVQAWGTAVVTCGFGDAFNPDNDVNRRYTSIFGGSSAAAAQVAGLAACLQGLARQIYGIHLPPTVIRQAIGTGFLQCGFGDPDDLFGFPAQILCGLDTDPDSGPNKIGIYTKLRGIFNSAAQVILNAPNAGFGDSPLIDEITILTGELIGAGTVFAIKGNDGLYYTVASRHTNPSDGGQSGHGGLAAGEVTDVMIAAHMDTANVQTLDLTVESYVSGGSGIELTYLFDWQLNRWLVVGVALVGLRPADNDASIITTFELPNASQFIRASDRQIMIRLWTISLGLSGPFQVFHDWVNIEQGGGGQFLSSGGL